MGKTKKDSLQPRLFEETSGLVGGLVGIIATSAGKREDWTRADEVWALRNDPSRMAWYRRWAALGKLGPDETSLLEAVDSGEGYKP